MHGNNFSCDAATSADCYHGSCTCHSIRYRLTAPPMFVHCCHCTWCQRETGSAFAMNALIENIHLEVLTGEVVTVATPSHSGKGQMITRCPHCHVALWSHYTHKRIAFVRVGTLNHPQGITPDVHIYTSTKQPWVILPEGVPAFRGYYSTSKLWPEKSLLRRAALNRKASNQK